MSNQDILYWILGHRVGFGSKSLCTWKWCTWRPHWDNTPPICSWCVFQLRVEIYDDANPSQRVETSVKITVQRNVNAPQFSQENYRANVVENYPIGASVVTVQARDNDNVSLHDCSSYLRWGWCIAGKLWICDLHKKMLTFCPRDTPFCQTNVR